jgi:4-amino-4-deoxy-L-arabinose transferase-like glycosyltransferase
MSSLIQRIINRFPLLILTLIWIVFIALPIGNRGLWAPDEPRYLQVAWEMERSGSFLVPMMNGEIYAEKPPLFFWLTILVSKLTPFESASRWVSALASLGILLLTVKLGEQSGSRMTGFNAALIVMTSSLFTLLMYTGNIDTTLTLLTTLSLFCFMRWESTGRSAYLILTYVACGIGILAKGPVALIVPWLPYAVWEIVKKVRREKASFLHLAWGPLIALAIAALWVLPACIAGGREYTEIILLKQQVGRAVKAYVHQRPWYEYLLIIGPNTLPWCILLLAAVPEIKRLVREKNRWVILYIIWFCSIFIFFSLISSKRERYLLPAYPVFGLLCAHAAARWTERKESCRSVPLVAILTLIGTFALLAFPLALPVLKDQFTELVIFPVTAGDWRLWALFGFGAAASVIQYRGLMLARARQHIWACNSLAIGLLILAAAAQLYYIPYIEPVKSARQAARSISNLIPPEGTLAFYRRRYDNGWNFYLNRARIPVIRDEQIQKSQPQHDLIILRQKHMDLLKSVLNMDRYRIAAIESIGSKKFVLLKRISD